VPLYINILYIKFKNIILNKYHWPRSEIKNLCKFFKAAVRNAPHSILSFILIETFMLSRVIVMNNIYFVACKLSKN